MASPRRVVDGNLACHEGESPVYSRHPCRKRSGRATFHSTRYLSFLELLQLMHTGKTLPMAWLPPRESGMTWSICGVSVDCPQ